MTVSRVARVSACARAHGCQAAVRELILASFMRETSCERSEACTYLSLFPHSYEEAVRRYKEDQAACPSCSVW